MKSITILIADDETEIADLIELHLVKEGYNCLKAADGQEALGLNFYALRGFGDIRYYDAQDRRLRTDSDYTREVPSADYFP